MIKKLCIILLTACTVAPLMAQQRSSSDDASFAPEKGNWQISVALGNSQQFADGMEYLLPKYWNGTGNAPGIGLGDDTGNKSEDPGMYLNLGSWNNNSLVNIIGLQGKYFLTDRWDVNLMFSMNIGVTPKKDLIEGDNSVSDMQIPASKYVEGRVKNNWMVNIGSNYYFNTKNERINLYVGGLVGWQMGRIETMSPNTGETVSDGDAITDYDDLNDAETLPLQVYIPSTKTGQIFGLRAAAVAGIEYSLGKGLVFGFELQPVAYRYDMIQICPKGVATYKVGHHNINLFAQPNLKLGFRF